METKQVGWAVKFNSPGRPTDNYAVANQVKDLFGSFTGPNGEKFDGLLPDSCLENAIATCRFSFQGPKSVGKTKQNWGEWIRTRMNTGGHMPNGFGVGVSDFACQRSGRYWVALDCHAIVEDLLSCVDLTIDDIWDTYGKPAEGDRYILDLTTIIRDCAGGLLLPLDRMMEKTA